MQSQRLQQLDQLAVSFLDALGKQLQKNGNEAVQRFLMAITLGYGGTYAGVFQLFLRLDNPKAFQVDLKDEEIVQLKLMATLSAAKLLDQEEYTFESIKNKILFQGFDEISNRLDPTFRLTLDQANQYEKLKKSSTQPVKQSDSVKQPMPEDTFGSLTDIYQYFTRLESLDDKKISSASACVDFYSVQHLSKIERNQGSYLTDEQRRDLIEKVKAQKTNIISGVELDMLQDLNQRVSLIEKFGQQNVQAFGGHFVKSDVEKIKKLSASPEKKLKNLA